MFIFVPHILLTKQTQAKQRVTHGVYFSLIAVQGFGKLMPIWVDFSTI